MKKLLTTIILFASSAAFAQIYVAKAGKGSVTFYSKAPLEDIEAVNKGGMVVFRPSTNDLQASYTMKSFKFKNALMEEHFNENYVESDKYPKCVFKGKINEKIDFSKDGEHKVTAAGTMELHGVTKEVNVTGTLTKKGDDIIMHATFPIKVADYNIKVPSMYVKNIAEVVDVTFDAVLEPKK